MLHKLLLHIAVAFGVIAICLALVLAYYHVSGTLYYTSTQLIEGKTQ